MSDRFRFRMFDKNISKMWNFDNDCMLETVFECLKQQLAFDSGLEIFKPIAYDHISDGRIFMQSTGLKDKNGKLIYEGDILKIESGKLKMENNYGCVKWCDTIASFGILNNNSHYDFKTFDCEYIEVIGNIYENKDLLDE